MTLDNLTKLEAVLAAAVAANQPEFHVTYSVWNTAGQQTRPETARGALNSNTDVTLLDVEPTQGARREILFWSIHNKDTAAVTATVKTDDGTNERIITKQTLQVGETLSWGKFYGFHKG